MLIIGLTGGISCGKSLVSAYFKQLGIPIIDTDIIAKKLVEPGQVAMSEIFKVFGSEIIDATNKLDRKKLRHIIFNSTHKRQQLETILHPKIHSVVIEKIASLKQNTINSVYTPYVIVVIPLLFETQSDYPITRTLVVDSSEQQQINRTMNRDNVTRQQSLAIINQQISRDKRLDKADDIIENYTDKQSVYTQLDRLHQKFTELDKAINKNSKTLPHN